MMMNDLRQRIEQELRGNILPFWIEHTCDEENGGFYGGLSNDLIVDNDQPRSAVLCARILWTYSSAYRAYGEAGYLKMACRAYDYLTQKFWDQPYGGVYWTLDRQGRPISDRKHIYAQAFAIYGLAEFYRATGEPESLRLAQDLFRLVERHSFDPRHGGNIEGCSREWGPLADMRLSDKEPNTHKSMNTLLHLMEAYTNLLRAWPAEELKTRQRGLIEMFLQHIIDPQTKHFRWFFADDWTSLSDRVSFGHDIEGSWLIVEAAEASGDAGVLAQAREVAVQMAAAVYQDGLDSDGAVLHEAPSHGSDNGERDWWMQAEGLVGFTNAYQLSQRAEFAQAADRLWQICETQFVDRQAGEWFKIVRRDGTPDPSQLKVGPWECPYHHSRACLEMLRRLA